MYLYVDENGQAHKVEIHNFDKRNTARVRIIGNSSLNPSDTNYPDKKWVMVSELYEPAKFSAVFILKNSL